MNEQYKYKNGPCNNIEIEEGPASLQNTLSTHYTPGLSLPSIYE